METSNVNHPKRVFLKYAILGSLGLFAFYYIILFLVTKDFKHPFTQFLDLQPWMSILIIGFGAQVGLYSLLKKGFRLNLTQKKDTKAASGAGGAVSGVSMVACCAHHAVDIAPILGVTGVAVFLTGYQSELLIFGIIANLFALFYMSWLIVGKKHPRKLLQYVFNGGELVS